MSNTIETKCVTWNIPCLKVLTCDEPQTCGGKHPVVSQQEEGYPCIKCGKLRPEIVSRLKNVSNQKFITESQMSEKLNQPDTDELVKAIRADQEAKTRMEIGEWLQDNFNRKDSAELGVAIAKLKLGQSPASGAVEE
jgi:hypothetical protein